ncbi:MAG: hypothetical protein KC476_11955, partial [Cyanobacteria bacterium HKST-UBA06]|nr:hypothetical protein [Cyanobacteria bacterium HKST-UBA06]
MAMPAHRVSLNRVSFNRPSTTRTTSRPRFGWSRQHPPQLLVTVSPGQDYVPSTLQPTPAFVERLATDQFVGRDVMADETPRAALILDRGGQQFKTAKAFETFIGNTVHAVGDYLKQ